jgi:hypothetical protein
MFSRCTNPKSPDYPYYGGRGIKVADEWKDFAVFLADVGPRPSPQHSLDRFPNVNGNYEKSNTRWATRKEQGRNKRNTKRYTFNGESLTLAEWAEKTGLRIGLLYERVNLLHWPIEQAISHNAKRRLITFNGTTKTLSEWGKHTGIDYDRIRKRIDRNHWSIKRALTTPVKHPTSP